MLSPDRRNNFDLLRLAAALQVVHAHAIEHLKISYGPVGQAVNDVVTLFPGVPVFFVISGFLISRSYARAADVGSYARNRFLRIFPALWVCFAVSLALLALSGALTTSFVESRTFWMWAAGQLTVAQFFNPGALRAFGVGVVNGSLWTIPVELQFYVALPILFWLLRRFGRGDTAGIGVLALLSFTLWCVWQHRLGMAPPAISDKMLQVTLAPHLFMFLLGVLLQRHWNRLAPSLEGKGGWWLALYGSERLVERLVIGRPAVVGHVATLSSAAASACSFVILALAVVSIAYTCRAAGERLLRGHDVSYGTYIYHMLVINALVLLGGTGALAVLPAVFIIVLVLAAASWMLVERPALRAKRSVSASVPVRAMVPSLQLQ